MNKNSSIYIAGSTGMVGSAIVRKLKALNYKNLITSTSKNLDLRDQEKVANFFRNEKPDYVFLAAAKVGGILANSKNKAQFLYDNLSIQNNVIHNSYKSGCKKLLFLGSSCIYPKLAETPIKEDQLLSGKLEETNDAYAIAKIAGIKLCESYRSEYGFNAISAMPTNLYGINDNFNLESSHVIPALINKFTYAKKNNLDEVVCWGSGKPMREFLYVDDLAEACIFLMSKYEGSDHINIGTGEDISIFEIAQKIAQVIGFEGNIVWDKTKPDGTLRKVLNVQKVNDLGWKHTTQLEEGLKKTVEWYSYYNS
jgi:GDP-L-fucose synthase